MQELQQLQSRFWADLWPPEPPFGPKAWCADPTPTLRLPSPFWSALQHPGLGFCRQAQGRDGGVALRECVPTRRCSPSFPARDTHRRASPGPESRRNWTQACPGAPSSFGHGSRGEILPQDTPQSICNGPESDYGDAKWPKVAQNGLPGTLRAIIRGIFLRGKCSKLPASHANRSRGLILPRAPLVRVVSGREAHRGGSQMGKSRPRRAFGAGGRGFSPRKVFKSKIWPRESIQNHSITLEQAWRGARGPIFNLTPICGLTVHLIANLMT